MREHTIPLLQQPAKRGARLIALRRLREADRTYPRAIDGDPQGLHAFRVALRRTRTTLRLYEPWLAESVSRKSERRLRRLTRASNRARDYEVIAAVAQKL